MLTSYWIWEARIVRYDMISFFTPYFIHHKMTAQTLPCTMTFLYSQKTKTFNDTVPNAKRFNAHLSAAIILTRAILKCLPENLSTILSLSGNVTVPWFPVEPIEFLKPSSKDAPPEMHMIKRQKPHLVATLSLEVAEWADQQARYKFLKWCRLKLLNKYCDVYFLIRKAIHALKVFGKFSIITKANQSFSL